MSAVLSPRTMRTASGAEVVLRSCAGFDELDACVRLQTDTWGYDETDVIPRRLFTVAQRIGGQVIGAFDGQAMVGFAMSLPGAKAGNAGPVPYLHSHMLAVKSEYRNAGIGRRLKLYQRDEALSRGISLMEWTFDPLEIKNSYLNIEKLGAIARRYNINQYGITSSPLQGGLPSDRLIAEWWLNSRRVETLLATGQNSAFSQETTIEVPAQIYEWKAAQETRSRARQVQERNREQFVRAFEDDLAVLGYERDAEGNGKFLLGEWNEEWSYASQD